MKGDEVLEEKYCYKGGVMENQKENDVIKKYTFPMKYHNTMEEYEFVLINESGKVFLKDQGRTVTMLDKMFELNESDVIKNLIAVLEKYKIVQKKGVELFIEINPWNGNIDERENETLNKAMFTLYACVSFMDTMHIFYE